MMRALRKRLESFPPEADPRLEGGAGAGLQTSASGLPEADDCCKIESFDDIYEEHVDFIWRSVRRLGVHESAVEDVTQEVFVVVHRRLADFEKRSSLRTWIYGIALGVVRNHRRSARRKPLDTSAKAQAIIEAAPSSERGRPDAALERREGLALLYRLLDGLKPELREVFVMRELEGMSAPQIAQLCGTKPSTVYARLHQARQRFDQAVGRLQAAHLRRVR